MPPTSYPYRVRLEHVAAPMSPKEGAPVLVAIARRLGCTVVVNINDRGDVCAHPVPGWKVAEEIAKVEQQIEDLPSSYTFGCEVLGCDFVGSDGIDLAKHCGAVHAGVSPSKRHGGG